MTSTTSSARSSTGTKAGPLLVASDLSGQRFAAAHSSATDEWFRGVFAGALGAPTGLALAAVGGYGRGALSPFSDVDVVLVHDNLEDYAEMAEALWYPVWDRGLKMGYAVVTLEQAEKLVANELHWATAFLSARPVAGNHSLVDSLAALTRRVWEDNTDEMLARLVEANDARHDRFGDVAFQIEPNLKEGRGGLRDLHALDWAAQISPELTEELPDLSAEADALLAMRVELHRVSGRAEERLSFDAQDDVANILTNGSAQELMLRVSRTARSVAWHSDEVWSKWKRRTGRAVYSAATGEPIATEFGLVDGHVELASTAKVATDPLVLLRLAATAARTGRLIGRDTLDYLRSNLPPMPEPWPADARELLAEWFLIGRNAIAVVEDLQQYELMTRLLPEWSAVLFRPQRNVMHTFTVDRHLCETAARAAKLADRVDRPDLLVVGALLHDIGKGFPGDHTAVGMEKIAAIADRMGYPNQDVAVLVDLCRHHLLLPDVATRRDLSDPGTISAVAAAVDSVDFLRLLAALTEADSLATGPSAWGSWKAGLMRQLVERTEFVLGGGAVAELESTEFPTEEIVELMDIGSRHIEGSGTTFTVVVGDRPDMFTRMAAVLVVKGLDVVDAQAYFDAEGIGACRFTIQIPAGGANWSDVADMANSALDGQMALTARVRRTAANQERFRRRLAAAAPHFDVVIDNEISDVATVVEVHAADTVGLLYWVTQALHELRLTIRSARIQTFGPQAVDSFYVNDHTGGKLTDPNVVSEVELALEHAIGTEEK